MTATKLAPTNPCAIGKGIFSKGYTDSTQKENRYFDAKG